MLPAKGKPKAVFGQQNIKIVLNRDMNIATPQNYVVGPGDNVIIDIWGASQKSLNQEVSPDGTITVEGFGPIEIGGLSISKANALIRSSLGSRTQCSGSIAIALQNSKRVSRSLNCVIRLPSFSAH